MRSSGESPKARCAVSGSMPSPSSGALTVLGVLKMLERFPIGDAGQGFGYGSPKTLN